MKRRILSAALCLCLILSLISVPAVGAEGGEEPEAAFQLEKNGTMYAASLADACANVYPGGPVFVLRDVELDKGLTVTKPMVITSADPENPCVITYSPKDRGDYLLKVFLTQARNAVYLQDVILDGGREKGRASQAELVCMDSHPGSALMLNSGAVIQNNDNVCTVGPGAGGLRFTSGMLYLNTGAVIRNCRGVLGGGVTLAGGNAVQMAVNGGFIENCQSFRGGGIFIEGSDTSDSSLLARLYVQHGGIVNNQAKIEMEGFTCPASLAPGCGGGIYMDRGIIIANPGFDGKVTGNHADREGGGIYNLRGTINLASGAVTGNSAKLHGGGITIISPYGHMAVGGDIQVTGNTSEDGANNLYLDLSHDYLDPELGVDGEDHTAPVMVAMALAETASIGLSRYIKPNPNDPDRLYRVVAEPQGSHTDISGDVAKFYSDDPRYVTLLLNKPGDSDDGKIVITTADVVFDNQDHGPTVPGQQLEDDHKVVEPDKEEMTQEGAKEGYDFQGWYEDENFETPWDFDNTIDATDGQAKPLQTLYAKWVPIEYEITYDLQVDEGEEVLNENPTHYNVESDDITLNPPIRVGWRFLGWREVPAETGASLFSALPRSEEAQVDIRHGSIGARRFEAQWERSVSCTVTYVDGVEDAEVFADQARSGLPLWSETPSFEGTPARPGYAFTGWEPEVTSRVSADTTVYTAQWEELPRCAVTYQDGVGGAAFADQVTPNLYQGAETPQFQGTPARLGYTFTRWEPQWAPEVTYSPEGTVYTAQWEAIHYVITYDLDGGTNAEGNPGHYTIETETVTLQAPTKPGYTFLGWTENGQDAPQKDVAIPKGSTGGKSYTAHWKKNATSRPTGSTPTPTPAPTPSLSMLEREDHFAYIIGCPDGTVRPEAPITRAEVAAIFFRLLTEETRQANLTVTSSFDDVPEDSWCAAAVSTLHKLGIVRGRSDAVYDPDAPITRGELAAVIARFGGGAEDYVSEPHFSDVSGHWAKGYIDFDAERGWVNGYEDGTFRPNANITRAETVTMINRVLGRLPKSESDLLPDMTVWPDNVPGDWHYLAVQEATNSHRYRRYSDGREKWTSLKPTEDWTQYQ